MTSAPSSKANIVVITTGGTIAMAEDQQTKSVRPLSSEALHAVLPYVSDRADVQMDHYLNIPSPHITPDIMYQISQRAKEWLERPETDGLVITHGTDTLEETAYYLDLVLHFDKPIVVTGAMRSQGELGADGPVNLVNAIRTAAHPRAKGKGVLVVFNDEIHAARWVTKTHTSNVATFRSPSHGPVGYVTKKDILFHQSISKKVQLPHEQPRARVDLIKAAAGTDDCLLRCALDSGAEGIVLEGLGQGNIPPVMLPGVKEALRRKIPIVLVSRCYNGIVQDVYGYEGGGKELKELGVVFSNGLNGQKARIQLIAALNVTKDPNALQEFFEDGII
jgi:L-asparaginase